MEEPERPDTEETGPQIGSDPQDLPDEGTEKKVVAPDPEKVEEAERQRKRREEAEKSEENR